MKLALAQFNATVGDFSGNTAKIVAAINAARKKRAGLIVFPELALCGYFPCDLLFQKQFLAAHDAHLKKIVSACRGITVVLGFVEQKNNKLYNAAAVIRNKRIIAIYRKQQLPSDDIFDEKRYFTAGTESLVFSQGQERIGILVCRDIWEGNALQKLAKKGCDVCVVINASPMFAGRHVLRVAALKRYARQYGMAFAFSNFAGANDHIIFDGRSFFVSKHGRLIDEAAAYEEDLLICDTNSNNAKEFSLDVIQDMHDALVLGIRDYAHKNGFSDVVLGLSGGIDSAVVCALAVEALGKKHVHAYMLPSKYTSEQSMQDAKDVAKKLGVGLETIPIRKIHAAIHAAFSSSLTLRGKADENVQARIRMSALMAKANEKNALLLAAGNKSELATGYCTLYGDLAGAIAPLGDVFKTEVYSLAGYINKNYNNRIPVSVLKKEPSAELSPGQKDRDVLPPYRILDKILAYYVVKGLSEREIVQKGCRRETVKRAIAMVAAAEHKRRQAPVSLRVSQKLFTLGRRMPVTQRFVPP